MDTNGRRNLKKKKGGPSGKTLGDHVWNDPNKHGD